MRTCQKQGKPGKTWPVAAVLGLALGLGPVRGQETAPRPAALSPPLPAAPVGDSGLQPLPINLPTALQLGNVRPLDIALAVQRMEVAAAQLQQAKVLWLPTMFLGGDYLRHDGEIQDVAGTLFDASKSAVMVGAGPYAVFALTDAIFSPLAVRQDLRAREAAVQTARNDSMLAVAQAYFNLQQARGELAGAADTVRRTEDLLHRVEKLATGLVPQLEVVRVRAELARRRQAVHAARERWRVASAELLRVLHMDPLVLVEPLEPPHMQVTLIGLDQKLDDLIPLGLSYRPELQTQQALVQATLQRLKQEKLRPLIPSILLRGASTVPGGTLGAGLFGGGRNAYVGDFNGRVDIDLQVLWELQNLGFGNRARVQVQRAENQAALIDLFRVQDRVAAEVAQAYAEAQAAAARVTEAEVGLGEAIDSVEKNFEGLRQTRRIGEVVLLVVRPQEALASVQALTLAYNDYYGTVADYDRAQFRLYRAVGQPAQCLLDDPANQPPPLPETAPVPRMVEIRNVD
jgi:outer membrane protein TolC